VGVYTGDVFVSMGKKNWMEKVDMTLPPASLTGEFALPEGGHEGVSMALQLGPPSLGAGEFRLTRVKKKGDVVETKTQEGLYGVDDVKLVLDTLRLVKEESSDAVSTKKVKDKKVWDRDELEILDGGSSVKVVQGADMFVLEKVEK
jgi:hypothetical protein